MLMHRFRRRCSVRNACTCTSWDAGHAHLSSMGQLMHKVHGAAARQRLIRVCLTGWHRMNCARCQVAPSCFLLCKTQQCPARLASSCCRPNTLKAQAGGFLL